jgi:hypothetical protein
LNGCGRTGSTRVPFQEDVRSTGTLGKRKATHGFVVKSGKGGTRVPGSAKKVVFPFKFKYERLTYPNRGPPLGAVITFYPKVSTQPDKIVQSVDRWQFR